MFKLQAHTKTQNLYSIPTIAFCLCLLFTSCTSTSRDESERAKSDLLGMSKTALMNCAGIPDRTGSSNSGLEYLAFNSEKLVNVLPPYPNSGFYPGFGFYGNRHHRHSTFIFSSGPQTVPETRSCTATFALKNDKIVSLSYQLNDSDSYGMSQCYQIVKNCLPEQDQ